MTSWLLLPCEAARWVPPLQAAVALLAARRVSARLPSNFHLRAQLKVTKAKGLNTSHLTGSLRLQVASHGSWHENSRRGPDRVEAQRDRMFEPERGNRGGSSESVLEPEPLK